MAAKRRSKSKTPRTLDDLRLDPRNARRHTPRNLQLIDQSLTEAGPGRSILVDERGTVLAGNATTQVARGKKLKLKIVKGDRNTVIAVQRTDLTASEKRRLALFDNRSAEMAEWDPEVLKGMDEADLKDIFSDKELTSLGLEMGEPADAEPQIDRAAELQRKWKTERGQLWRIGEHRLLCGDSTMRADVERVMGGEKAALLHADPPYGMGKENEGIENDNLCREKLDAFQMGWWRSCRPSLDDNASAYIWGTADDLWRLWYSGGLRDSERVTFRNEIVWRKHGAQGIASEAHRQYPTASERCLFFMLGEQGFNNNADNYWEGWNGIVDYLEQSRQAMGWSIKDTKRIAGHSENSGCHWFDKSQWSMPTEETYKRWQAAARDYGAFKRDYDDIKREFYATRAYFDNAHDNMTDIWDYGRVVGEERLGHATPKPVEMVERAITSSAPERGIVLIPFGGTAPEIVACQNLGRKGRGIEISPGYVAVCLERMATAFPGIEIELLDERPATKDRKNGKVKAHA